MIMSILWKRLNDTGKNWRHVYKALTVLEYMVANGSERVIEEIREHAYQIQMLADFQYIDSSGRDQGNNVRKKSQNLVVLVNDKERILEVRQKAAANRDKFQNSSAGSMYRPGSHSSSGGYGERYDDRYGSRDEERNGYGGEREYSYKDDRYGDSYNRDGDRYSREYEDRYGREDDYSGRSRSVDGSQHGSRSRSSDRDRARDYEDDGQYSSRESGAKADDQSQDRSPSGQKLDRNYPEQNLSAPPSYEEVVGGVDAVGSARNPTHSDRDGETSADAPKSYSPPANRNFSQETGTAATVPSPGSSATPAVNTKEADRFDEFDPRGSFPDSSTDNSLALVPTTSFPSSNEVDTSSNSASGAPRQGFEDPFGDGPFKAIPSNAPGPQQSFLTVPSFQNASNSGPELTQHVSQNLDVAKFPGETSTSSGDPNIDILADIFPMSGHQHPVSSQPEYSATVNQALPQPHQTGFPAQSGQAISLPNQSVPQIAFSESGPSAHQTSFSLQSQHPVSPNDLPPQSGQLVMHPNFSSQFGQPTPQAGFPGHNFQPSSVAGYPNESAQASLNDQPESGDFTSPVNILSHSGIQSQPGGQYGQPNVVPYDNYSMQSGGQNMIAEVSSVPASQQNVKNFHVSPQSFQAPQVSQSGFPSSASISTAPAKDKFETKSTVWTDTLSRGLVNLNISGSKTNPLSDIGVDFDALNRKEKRMEKPAATSVTSTVHMGKAMGSGSGIGRAGAGVFRPTSNPMMGVSSGAGMGMARPGASMGGYGAVNQQPMGAGMGMNMAPNMGMGMNMGMGAQMQRPMGFPPRSNMPGGYNPMMGTGNYGQNQYGGGYRQY
ncbi:hypothetical protein Leryth_022606 [Lithospermum erythrorhizon]|nr:hypothetical protein Leryth_022606 [Lithospermum erythrorhizon]